MRDYIERKIWGCWIENVFRDYFNKKDIQMQDLGEKDVQGLRNISMQGRIVEKGFNAEEFFPEFNERIEEFRRIQEKPNYRVIGTAPSYEGLE
jgi:hypothetical protein